MTLIQFLKKTCADLEKLIHILQITTTKTTFFKFPFLNRGRYTPWLTPMEEIEPAVEAAWEG